MQPSTQKPTKSEKKFDRAKEEAFSNEGAPSPVQVSPLHDDAEVDSGKDEAGALASAVSALSIADSQSAAEPAAQPVAGAHAPL
jgi:hypothetical protein